PDLFNILLQVMDHGKLTDHNGKQVNFRNTILIMTTNAGASDLAKAAIGFNRTKREGDDTEAINRMFTPEFRNRLDAVVPFSSLPPEVIAKVVEKFIFQLEAQLADRNVTIEISDAATAWLAETGYDEKFGARPLARVIQERVKKPLAEELLFGKLEFGGTARISLVTEPEKKLGFEYVPLDPSKRPKARDEDDDEDTPDGELLVGAAARKALPSPKEKREKPKSGPTGNGSTKRREE
ncbi:MAG TPA: AAA family ATPase, partial [Hyphomicrobiaceae bacterium]|nr:AAA family ATPase [Hyphomicrobiaceae bacterium]